MAVITLTKVIGKKIDQKIKKAETAEQSRLNQPSTGQQSAKPDTSATTNSIPQTPPVVNKKNAETSRPSLRPGRVLRAEGVSVQKFSDAQYATYKAAEIMARALGTDIVIHESLGKTKDGKVINGYFDPGDGRIHVNINAMRDGSHIGLYVLSHEVTHAIKEWSPRKYAELERFVMERLGADAEVKIEAKLKQMRDAGLISETATEAEAYALAKEEVVAEGMEDVLSDGKVLEALAKQNRTLWQKIKDVVTAAIGKIKAAFGDLNKHSKTAQVLTNTVESLESLEQLFYEGVVDAGEARKSRTAGAVTRMNTGKMQVGGDTYDFTKPFYQQVEDYKNNLFPKKDSLVLGATPEVFTSIGFNALPMTINQKHVDYILNGTKNADHEIGEIVLKYIPTALKNPVAIIASETEGSTSVVAILSITHNGKQINVPVYIDGIGKQNGIRMDVNAVTSVYARNNAITKLLKNALQTEASGQIGLFYWNKKRALALLSGGKVTMPNVPNTLSDGSVHSIRENGSPVKPKLENVTESQQFKRWFGDWQKNPKKASKIVNADGMPKIVFHGTNENFTVFQSKDGLYWFSENADYAESMAEERGGDQVMEVYLNMRNPYVASLPPGKFSDPSAETPIIEAAKKGGHDGIIIKCDTTNPLEAETFYVVFKPTQIKSATDNIGTFDGTNPDIRYSIENDDADIETDASETVEDEVARIRAEAEAKIERVRAEAEAKIEKAQKRQDDRVAKERERADARIEGWRENRQATKDRHSLRRSTSRLYKRLLSPTKERNVPESLRAAVAESMLALNMDSKVIDQIANIEAEIEKLEKQDAPDLDKIGKLESKLYKLEEQAATLGKQSEALLKAYEEASREDGSPLAEEIVEKLRELQTEIGNAGIYNMDHKQLRAARDFYDMILHQVTNANKMFAADRQTTVEKAGRVTQKEKPTSVGFSFCSPLVTRSRIELLLPP